MIYNLALSMGIALVISLISGPILIPQLHKWKFGQNIRLEGPRHHQRKAGTPTIGGLIILIAVLIPVCICAFPLSMTSVICLVSFVAFGILGGLDDIIKIIKKRNLGLTAMQKILGQIIITCLVLFLVAVAGNGTEITIPFIQDRFDMGLLYYPVIGFLIVGMVNAVNLTDGLDGLASGSVTFSSFAFFFIALVQWTRGLDEAWDVMIFACALIGACIGFLRFNAYPAKVFMGDCGSLALGGALSAMAILTHTEILLLLIGIVYVVEVLSVILQVFSFKVRGKRIFRMSPLHHHFELGGWNEQKVVRSFWFCSFVAALMGIWLYVA